jgi:hypothetical protein
LDASFVIWQRLEEFGLQQRELARATQATESYISQLLTRKKAPDPAPTRTDIYDKMEKFLKLPSGELACRAQLWSRQHTRAVESRQTITRERGSATSTRCVERACRNASCGSSE